jgi:hypothetical protein
MPDYGFYRDVYLGTSVPQGAFDRYCARASQWLQQLERYCRVVSYGEDSRKMALCAAADVLYVHGRRQGISQTSIGGVSVHYRSDGASLQQRLLQAVCGYLEVYRGVS